MSENASSPRPRPAKARVQTQEFTRRAERDNVKATLDECRHTLDLQFQRMAQMQAEIDRLKADTDRTTAMSSPTPYSGPPSEEP